MSSISGGGGIGNGPSGVNLGLGGLITGMDSQTIIQKLIQFESLPITLMNNQIAGINKIQAAWNDISTATSSLISAAQTLNQSTTWSAVQATSSDLTVATAIASTGATAGTFAIKSNLGGVAEKDGSKNFASATTGLGLTGQISLGLGSSSGGGAKSVTVAATNTLTDIMNSINSANAGVTASIVQTGTQYRLVLTANSTGAANAIHYNDNNSGVLTGLGILSATSTTDQTAAASAVLQAAQDTRSTAMAQLDASTTYTSPTNTLGLTGTFNLGLGSASGSITVAATDTLTTLMTKINGANLGITASVVQTGTNYQLVLNGNNTGAANAIHYNTLSNNVLTSLGFLTTSNSIDQTAASGAVQQAAQDANPTPMARSEQDASATYTSSTTALNLSGTINLGLGGSAGTGSGSVSITTTDTLTTIASKINAANAGITASVLQTGSTSYRLVLTGNNTGAANNIHYNDNSSGVLSSLGLIKATSSVDQTAAAGAVVQTAQDAKITVNGLAVQSASNTITSAVPGVTLKLVNLASSNQVTITNGLDTAGIQKNVQAFVDGYNGLVNTAAKYNLQGGPLQGNTSLLSLLRQMSRDVLSVVPGLPTTMNSLQQIGITVQKTGLLAFDAGKFQSQLSLNPSGVQSVFNQASTGISQVVNGQLKSYTQTNGIFSYIQQNLNTQVQNIQKRETALQQRLTLLQSDLVQRFAKMEQMIGQLRTQGNALASAIGAITPSSSSSSSTSR